MRLRGGQPSRASDSQGSQCWTKKRLMCLLMEKLVKASLCIS